MSDDQYQLILTEEDYAKLAKQKIHYEKLSAKLKQQLNYLIQSKELQRTLHEYQVAFLVQNVQHFVEKNVHKSSLQSATIAMLQKDKNSEYSQTKLIPIGEREVLCTKYEKLLIKLESIGFLLKTQEQNVQNLQQKYEKRQQQWLDKYQTELDHKIQEIQKLRHEITIGKQLENDMMKLLQELNSRCHLQNKNLQVAKLQSSSLKEELGKLQKKYIKCEQQLNDNKKIVEENLRYIDSLKIKFTELQQANDYLGRQIEMKLNDNKFLLQQNKDLKMQVDKLRDLRKKTRSKEIISTIDSYINQLHQDLFKMQGINYGEIKSILVNELQHIAKHIEGILRDINLDV